MKELNSQVARPDCKGTRRWEGDGGGVDMGRGRWRGEGGDGKGTSGDSRGGVEMGGDEGGVDMGRGG